MLRFQVGGLEPFVKKLDEMQKSLDDLQQSVPAELTAWQAEDLHRKRPFTKTRKRRRSLRASTVVRPRSKKSQIYRATRRAAIRAAARAMHRRSGLHRLKRNTPILRPALFAMLHERMSALLAAINWK